jgi:hypothetical protein
MQGYLFVLTGKASDVASGLGDCSAISPAMRLASASNHVSLVVSIVSMASPMLRQASSNWPSSAYALPRYDECNGIQNAVPADRNAAMPEVILWTAKAQEYFERALAVSHKQQAKSWELRAAMSMAGLWRDQGKVQQARELLAPVYGWFTEGFDTRDLKEAKALLDMLP